MLSPEVRDALTKGGVIDITTIGRKTGEPRRIEIVFHVFDGRVYIAGLPRPRPRDWLANMEKTPRITFHLKRDVVADLPASVRPIHGEEERRDVLSKVMKTWNRPELEFAQVMQQSPLVEVTFDE